MARFRYGAYLLLFAAFLLISGCSSTSEATDKKTTGLSENEIHNEAFKKRIPVSI